MKRKIILAIIGIVLAFSATFTLVGCSHNHEWKTEWSSDNTHHWHDCAKEGCEQVSQKQAHTSVDGSDEYYHWKECSVCGFQKDKQEHSFGRNLICSDCGYKHIHTYGYDEKCHWYNCTNCDDISIDVKTEHDFDKEGFCRECNYLKGSDVLEFELNGDGNSYKMTGFNIDFENGGSDEDIITVIIPEYYEGKPVTIIGEKAFENKTKMEKVILPKTIEKIESRAFGNCISLYDIVIPKNVKIIEKEVFVNCYGVTIKAEAKQAPSGWRTSDWKLQTSRYPIVWNCKNNNIADDGFEYIIHTNRDGGRIKLGLKDGYAVVAKQPRILNSRLILDTKATHNGNDYKIEQIADYAFYEYGTFFEDEILYSIQTLGSIERIGNYAFAKCEFLTSVDWSFSPQSSYYLGACAFAECAKLADVKLPANLVSIEGYAFQSCTSLKNITIPQNVSEMGGNVFEGCVDLIIRCKIAEKPSGWRDNWNSDFEVIWDCNNQTQTK